MNNIPKIIHILFNNEDSEIETELISKIKNNNLNYTINIYYKYNIDNYLLEYKAPTYLINTKFKLYVHNLLLMKHKIRWLKFNILYKSGGIWIDSKSYLNKSIDSFLDLNNNYDIYGYESLYSNNIIDTNYFLITTINNIFIELYIKELELFFNNYCLNLTDILNNGLKNYYKDNVNYFTSNLVSNTDLIKKGFPYSFEELITIKILTNNLELKNKINIIEPLNSKMHPLFWCSQYGNIIELDIPSCPLHQSVELQNILISKSVLWLINKENNNINKFPIIFLYNNYFIKKFEFIINSYYTHKIQKNISLSIFKNKKIIKTKFKKTKFKKTKFKKTKFTKAKFTKAKFTKAKFTKKK